MRCKYAFFKYQLWLPFLRGTLQKKWERLLIRSRMFHPLSSSRDTDTTPSLVFPRWDVVVVILSVFLMTYTYIEAKSNYHRGSILILRYVLVRDPFLYTYSLWRKATSSLCQDSTLRRASPTTKKIRCTGKSLLHLLSPTPGLLFMLDDLFPYGISQNFILDLLTHDDPRVSSTDPFL